MRHYQRSGNYAVAAVSLRSGIDTINNMDTIDAIDIIDESRVVEYIILSVQDNALGVT